MVNVLFVCLGNICRSPSAEGVFGAVVERERLADRIQVDSAGTASYHLGRPPDPRAQAVARRRGIDLSGLRARRIEPNDFRRFDHLLAMDRRNHADLLAICPPGAEHRLSLFLAFAPEAKALDVPDPYLGGSADFERMLDLIELGARGLLAHLRHAR